jgi:protein tyrosine/serine phosphatase
MSGFAAMNVHMRTSCGRLLALSLLAILPACGGVPPKASPTDPAGNFSEVSPGIYRSGRPDQTGVEDALVKLGVKTIIDLENDDAAIAAERGWAQRAGINFISEPMNGLDTPNDKEVNDILAKISSDQPVLVHCMEGHDRTGLIIALYRVLYEHWAPKAAHDEMMARGYNGLLISMNQYFENKTGWSD